MVLKTEMRRGFLVLGIAIFLMLSGLFALARADEEESARTQSSIRREVEQKYLDDAIGAFRAGDYGRAGNIFGMLSESAQFPEIGRQALFGFAAAKLVSARSSEEFDDAMASWKKWSEQFNSGTACEDPGLLTPFLLRVQPLIKDIGSIRPPSVQGGRTAKADLKGVLQGKEKEMASLRSKLELREREVRRLRLQLESLEEIHQKYQEKKQEVTPATPAPHK